MWWGVCPKRSDPTSLLEQEWKDLVEKIHLVKMSQSCVLGFRTTYCVIRNLTTEEF